MLNLAILFGAGALMGRSVSEYMTPGPPIVIRKIFTVQPENWMAHELCSEEALRQVSETMDLDLLEYEADVASGLFKVVVISQHGAPKARQVVAILEAYGQEGGRMLWRLNSAFHPSYGNVTSDINYDRINAVVEHLNDADNEPIMRIQPAPVQMPSLTDDARSIEDATDRLRYMNQVMSSQRTLAQDPEWTELLQETQSEMVREATQ